MTEQEWIDNTKGPIYKVTDRKPVEYINEGDIKTVDLLPMKEGRTLRSTLFDDGNVGYEWIKSKLIREKVG